MSEISEAGSISDALRLVEEERFDMLFLDLGLPDSTPVETVGHAIGLFEKSLPVVVLTSLDNEELGRQAIRNGAQDYLSKDKMTADLLRQTTRFAMARFETKRQLRERNQDLSNFAHTLAHEIRNPLQPISMTLEMVQEIPDSQLPGGMMEMIKVARNSAGRINEIIDSFLSLAESGENLPVQEVSLNEIFREILEEIELSQDEKITFTIHKNLPHVVAPPVILSQVFNNLIRNAVRYQDKERRLELQVRVEEQAERHLIHLTDNGIGIHRDEVQNIFRPFYRISQSSERAGHGIGLSFCQRALANLGGDIAVTSELGVGSTFTVEIPR